MAAGARARARLTWVSSSERPASAAMRHSVVGSGRLLTLLKLYSRISTWSSVGPLAVSTDMVPAGLRGRGSGGAERGGAQGGTEVGARPHALSPRDCPRPQSPGCAVPGGCGLRRDVPGVFAATFSGPPGWGGGSTMTPLRSQPSALSQAWRKRGGGSEKPSSKSRAEGAPGPADGGRGRARRAAGLCLYSDWALWGAPRGTLYTPHLFQRNDHRAEVAPQSWGNGSCAGNLSFLQIWGSSTGTCFTLEFRRPGTEHGEKVPPEGWAEPPQSAGASFISPPRIFLIRGPQPTR